MQYTQRDIVKVKNRLIENIDPHPFLILSCENCISHEKERLYTGVMLTHSNWKDRFSIPIMKDWIDGKWADEWSQIRVHLIASFRDSDISTNNGAYLGKVKRVPFIGLVNQIKDFVFKIDNP